MNGWNISTEFFSIPEVIRIASSRSAHDMASSLRGMILVKLLCLSADGMIFQSMEGALSIVAPERWRSRHAMDVWFQAVTETIIRKDGDGYSAVAWMAEKGLLVKRAKTAPKTAIPNEQPPAAVVTGQKPEQKPIKIMVRPCVYLTKEQIDELKLAYSDEDLAFMFDTLSDYKSRNPTRRYADDIIPLQGWVARTLREKKTKLQPQSQSQQQPKKEGEPFEIPQWLIDHRF